jgi:hypothetical protein
VARIEEIVEHDPLQPVRDRRAIRSLDRYFRRGEPGQRCGREVLLDFAMMSASNRSGVSSSTVPMSRWKRVAGARHETRGHRGRARGRGVAFEHGNGSAPEALCAQRGDEAAGTRADHDDARLDVEMRRPFA